MDSPPTTAKKRPSPAVSRSSSNKFFRCFKPAALDDDDCGGGKEKRGADEPVFAYVAVKERDGHVLHKVPPGAGGDGDSDDCGKTKKKNKGLRVFSRATKAVFFETSLARMMQRRKSERNSLGSISNLSTKADRILKLMHQKSGSRVLDDDNNVRSTESDVSTSLCTSVATTTSRSTISSRSSSMNSSLRGTTKSSTQSSSFGSKQVQLSATEDCKERPFSSENSAICLLLLTLLVLVLWGKVCAIVCTSTWLFFVPRWSLINCIKSSLENGDDSWDVDSTEYKKKIILEGLLQRKRSRSA